MSDQSSSSSFFRANRAGSLATAIATPALFMSPAGMAQTTGANQAAELAPIHVQGNAATSYDVKQSASQKFTAPLVDTPKSVQIIPAEVMKDQAASSLTDVLRNTPGITFGAGEGGNPLGDRPFIRGYDAQGSTYVDGLRDIGATSREVFNLEQVEVVKGSDGAYGGRGGAGGSINLISKTAKLDDFTNASLGLGTDNYYRGTIDSNWRLSDTTAFRLNGMYHDADVAGRDAVNNHRWGIAPTISFGLGTPTRVTLSYYHLQTDDLPDSGIPYGYPRVGLIGPIDVDRDNFYGLTSDYRRTQSDMATIGIEHDFSDRLTLRNTSRYTKSDQRYVWTQPDDSQGNVVNGKVWRRMNSRISDVESIANQTELVGKFETGSLKHSFNVGIELSEEKGKKDSLNVNRGSGSGAANACKAGIGAASNYNCTSLYNPNPNDPWVNTGTGGPNGQYSKTKNTTKSIYAFDTIEFNKQWQAGLGLRVDDYSSKFTNTPANKFAVIRRDDTLVNYQLGLVYKPADNGSVYVSYATSSTPSNSDLGEGSGPGVIPGRGNVGLNASDLAPEKNKTYEIGTKWDVLNNSVSLTAAIFRTETTNARITMPNNDYAMAGKKKVDGLELGISGAITPKWNIFAGYTYLNAKITDGGPNGTDEGNVFPNTPKHSASLWTTYKVLPKLVVGGGAYFVDKQYGNTANNLYIPSYWRFDAMAGYEVNKNLNVQLNVFNLTDKTYYDKAYASHYASIAPGRSAILSMNLSY
ncbi:MAG TPA: TonB-dependent siderophore receptor [Candidimonas sp.]|nr:TonB-dependent siderophore receptor [Candidimonas sp.]